jgi:hypothetical protein
MERLYPQKSYANSATPKVLTFKTSDSTEFTADVYCAVMFTVVVKE